MRHMSKSFDTSCMVPSDHHSSDTVEVWHGYTTPAVGCGFHAMNHSSQLFDAHRELMGKAS